VVWEPVYDGKLEALLVVSSHSPLRSLSGGTWTQEVVAVELSAQVKLASDYD